MQEKLQQEIKEVQRQIDERRTEIGDRKRKETKVRPERRGPKDDNPYPQLNADPDDPKVAKYLRYRKTFDLTRPNELRR